MIDKLFLLFAGHFLADFPLQGEYLAKMKNRHNAPDVPPGQKPTTVWFYALTAHAMIHGLVVFLITGRMDMMVVQFVSHWIADFMKCENITNPHSDQIIHYWILICIWLYTYVWI